MKNVSAGALLLPDLFAPGIIVAVDALAVVRPSTCVLNVVAPNVLSGRIVRPGAIVASGLRVLSIVSISKKSNCS